MRFWFLRQQLHFCGLSFHRHPVQSFVNVASLFCFLRYSSHSGHKFNHFPFRFVFFQPCCTASLTWSGKLCPVRSVQYISPQISHFTPSVLSVPIFRPYTVLIVPPPPSLRRSMGRTAVSLSRWLPPQAWRSRTRNTPTNDLPSPSFRVLPPSTCPDCRKNRSLAAFHRSGKS